MIIETVLNNIDKAIAQLLENEKDILIRGLNELNLSGHMTKYLTPLFSEYTVDPEYNGDKLNENDRKALTIAKSRMLEIGMDPKKHDAYPLTPDIVIHKRNTNAHNLVVFEVKKDSNTEINKKYDLLKLEHMTVDYFGNRYHYKLGVAIIFGTKKHTGEFEMYPFGQIHVASCNSFL